MLVGLAHMFDPYRDRVVVAEIDANKPLVDAVDIALYDTFAQPEADHDDVSVLVYNPPPDGWPSTPGTSIRS